MDTEIKEDACHSPVMSWNFDDPRFTRCMGSKPSRVFMNKAHIEDTVSSSPGTTSNKKPPGSSAEPGVMGMVPIGLPRPLSVVNTDTQQLGPASNIHQTVSTEDTAMEVGSGNCSDAAYSLPTNVIVIKPEIDDITPTEHTATSYIPNDIGGLPSGMSVCSSTPVHPQPHTQQLQMALPNPRVSTRQSHLIIQTDPPLVQLNPSPVSQVVDITSCTGPVATPSARTTTHSFPVKSTSSSTGIPVSARPTVGQIVFIRQTDCTNVVPLVVHAQSPGTTALNNTPPQAPCVNIGARVMPNPGSQIFLVQQPQGKLPIPRLESRPQGPTMKLPIPRLVSRPQGPTLKLPIPRLVSGPQGPTLKLPIPRLLRRQNTTVPGTHRRNRSYQQSESEKNTTERLQERHERVAQKMLHTKYKCCKCSKCFAKKQTYVHHLKMKHFLNHPNAARLKEAMREVFKCRFCKMIGENTERIFMYQHLENHEKYDFGQVKKSYSCTHCKMYFTIEEAFKVHKAEAHGDKCPQKRKMVVGEGLEATSYHGNKRVKVDQRRGRTVVEHDAGAEQQQSDGEGSDTNNQAHGKDDRAPQDEQRSGSTVKGTCRRNSPKSTATQRRLRDINTVTNTEVPHHRRRGTKKEKRFQCTVCCTRFARRRKFNQHELYHQQLDHQGKLRMFSCISCHLFFDTKNTLSRHFDKFHINVFSESIFTSVIVAETQKSKTVSKDRATTNCNSMDGNLPTEHSMNAPDRDMSEVTDMDNNSIPAWERPVQADRGKKKAAAAIENLQSLAQSLNTESSIELNDQMRIYEDSGVKTKGGSSGDTKCPVCGEDITSREEHMNIHQPVDIITNQRRRYSCGTCHVYFLNAHHHCAHAEKVHRNAVSEVHRCRVCHDVTFEDKYDLYKHQSVHEPFVIATRVLKPYHCVACNMYFRNLDAYSSHRRQHVRDVLKSKPMSKLIPPDLSVECYICRQAFATPELCRIHFRVHQEYNKETGIQLSNICNCCLGFFNKKSMKSHVCLKPNLSSIKISVMRELLRDGPLKW